MASRDKVDTTYHDQDQQDKSLQPSNSNDGGKEARIMLRRARIEASRVSKLKTNEGEGNEGGSNLDHQARRAKKIETENKETSKSKSQTTLSLKRIESVRESGNEAVTNIRAGITARESIRRSEEIKRSQLWDHREFREVDESKELEKKIEDAWSRVEKLAGPYELQGLLVEQKESCKQLMVIKDELIQEYVSELKGKDDEYVRELKRQTEEIDKLLDRMEVQYKNYATALMEEAEQIERAFVEERSEIIQTNSKEIDKLFENRTQNEGKYMEERANRIEDYIKQLEQLRINDSEEYNLVKIKLETDVQVLEQQLQQMRVTYQLNQEKLEYNYQVLKKREEENGTILGSQKRKINRLADHLNVLRIKSAKQEKMFQQENQSLNDDYKHLTEQFKELQKKFRHFQMADSKRFKDIWRMNEEEAKEIMRKVLQADRIIYEQQLGMKWEPPSDDLFRNVDPLIFHSSTQNAPKDLLEAENEFENELDLKTKPEGELKESLTSKLHDHKKLSKTMKKTLELLCNEAGFLVEDKLQRLLAPLHKDEQSLMRLDSIFKALNVETVEDIERLTSYFVKDMEGAPVTEKTRMINENEAMLIHPNQVISAIKKFVEQSRSMITKTVVNGKEEKEQVEEVEDEAAYDPEAMAIQVAKNKHQMQKKYWNRMGNVISDKSFRTWNAVYVGMEKYYQILMQRWQTSQNITSIEQQNNELKNLLRQYMSARVNEELQVPPFP